MVIGSLLGMRVDRRSVLRALAALRRNKGIVLP
jgi:hypothetical protein